MQKKLFIMSLLVVVLTDCSKIDSNNSRYADVMVDCLSNKTITNDVALGYKYYLPKGVKLIKNYDYNQVFLVNDIYLYMYVDINGYYYKSDIKGDDVNSFYFQTIRYDGKNGYIKIVDKGDKYYTEMVYHYARIEFYSKKEELNTMITYSSIILNNVKFNRKIIERVLEDSLGSFSEVTYQVEKPEDSSNNFSRYLEEYVQEEDSVVELPDE